MRDNSNAMTLKYIFIIFIAHSYCSISRVAVIVLHGPYTVGQWKGLVGSHFLVWKKLKKIVAAFFLVLFSVTAFLCQLENSKVIVDSVKDFPFGPDSGDSI